MDADVYVEKSFEEVLEDFVPLKKNYIRKLCGEYQVDNGYDKDDIDSICNLYIWRAYETYTNTEVAFPHYLNTVLRNGINTDMRKFRRTDKQHSSLDRQTRIKNDGESDCYHDTLPGDTTQEYIAVGLLTIEKIVDSSIEKHRTIFNERFKQDMNCGEIADRHGMNPKQVSKILSTMKGKMKN